MNTRKRRDTGGYSHTHRRKPVTIGRESHRISRRMIDPDALGIIHRLRRYGFTAYLTGAAVQNLMQNVPPKDFDIVTDCRPGQIKRRFSNARLIGRRFRLAHIYTREGKIIEVATFRSPSDIEKDEVRDDGSRHKRTYGTPREDAFQRDISVNALFYDAASDKVIDYVDGLRDLEAKRIRVIGDPAERFVEDPVRIIRVVRHAARLGFHIERKTEKEIFFKRHLLNEASGSRLFEEFNKDLTLKTRSVLAAYRSYGLLQHFIGQSGEDYQADSAMFSRVLTFLEIKETAESPFSKEEIFALILWPWIEKRFAKAQGDIHERLKEALPTGPPGAILPRKLRTDCIQILTLTRAILQVLQTGRWRRSWERRSLYASSFRLSFVIEKGRLPREGESSDDLKSRGTRSKKKRRGPRRRREAPVSKEPMGKGDPGTE